MWSGRERTLFRSRSPALGFWSGTGHSRPKPKPGVCPSGMVGCPSQRPSSRYPPTSSLSFACQGSLQLQAQISVVQFSSFSVFGFVISHRVPAACLRVKLKPNCHLFTDCLVKSSQLNELTQIKLTRTIGKEL